MTSPAPPTEPPTEPLPEPLPVKRTGWRGWWHPRRRRLAGRSLAVVAVLTAIGIAVWGVAQLAGAPPRRAAEPPALEVPPAAVQPGVAAPAPGRRPSPQVVRGRDAVREWANRLASVVNIPERALRAYGVADVAMLAEAPRCRVSWTTLAGIGRIESDHGRSRGAVLGADGRTSKPIVGVPLDGSPGVAKIGDTDGGRLDGDAAFDRAVGPMQFIPSTWGRWAADADGDGQSDPHDIDDAALAAARYLCAGRRDVGSPQGWWAAVLSYNRSVEYGQRVFAAADGYARRSTG